MSTYGRPEEHIPPFNYANNEFNVHCTTVTSPSLNWAHQGISQSPEIINRPPFSPTLPFGNCDFQVTHADTDTDAFYHQAIPGQSNTTVTRGDFIPNVFDSSQTSGFQHQTDSGHQIDAAFGSPFLGSAYQPVPQSHNHITVFGDHLNCPTTSPSNLDDHAFLYPNVISGWQSQATPQLRNLSSDNGFGGPDGFDNFGSFSTTASGQNKMPIPTAGIATAPVSTNANTDRLTCNHLGCTATFARAGDLIRHSKKHGTLEYPCPVDNCGRKGNKAFYRLDKLRNHQRKKHRMVV